MAEVEPVRIFWTGTGTGGVIFSGPLPVPAAVIFPDRYRYRYRRGSEQTGLDRRGTV